MNPLFVDFHSKILGKKMPMYVYLPENHEKFKSLPVLYFLHGRNGNENIMFDAGINAKADELINRGIIKPMMIVCPRIENSRGLNSAIECREVLNSESRIYNVGRYEDYLIKELIPFVDNTYNTINDRKGRFAGGASAGGYAALHNALRHQDMFSRVGGHMPAIELKLEEEDRPHFPDKETWDKYDPINIAKNEGLSLDIQVYLDAGDKDEGGFYEGCSILQNILEEKGINSQNHIFPGHHNTEYIQSNIEKYLIFYGSE